MLDQPFTQYVAMLQAAQESQSPETIDRCLDDFTPTYHNLYLWRVDQLMAFASRSWDTLEGQDPRLIQHHQLGGFEVFCRWFAEESLPQKAPYHPPYTHRFLSPQSLALAFAMQHRYHKIWDGYWKK